VSGGRSADAREFIDLLVDRGSWRAWDSPAVDPVDPGTAYGRQLAAAREKSGFDESVVTGEGLLYGRPVAIVASEMSFLGGSIGVTSAERLTTAVERATRERLPLIAVTASGGMRMQEGTVGFLQMVKLSASVTRHRRRHLPYLAYLRNPTTGGVFASWGSLGHLTMAEPGALIGFAGPRVHEEMVGGAMPGGVQVAENLVRVGVLDGVVEPGTFRESAATALSVMCGPGTGAPSQAALSLLQEEVPAGVPAWESVERSRRADRPGLRELLALAAADVTWLNGSGEGDSDSALVLVLARFGEARCVLLGHDRRGHPPAIGPAGLRIARRGMKLAEELTLPLVTVVDTPGAAISRESEEGALSGEIARCLSGLIFLESPTVSVLLGEGAGGAALALLPCDRVLCSEHAWLAPLAPEAAGALLYRSGGHAAELAELQRVRSADLLADGIVDQVLPECPDAADEPAAFCRRVGRFLEEALRIVGSLDSDSRLSARLDRYRRLGA
jgi:acetyl-CoA carboxylase carboxyl transferase beta subunit